MPGTLFGTVTDITGGVLDDVRIEVVGPVLRTAVTSADGNFEISGLFPGMYSVTVARAGFAVYEETLEVGGTRRELPIDLSLSPFTQFVETVSRVVEEQAEAPFLVTQVRAGQSTTVVAHAQTLSLTWRAGTTPM